MSTMTFDGSTHKLTVTASNGTEIGTYRAYNNVDSTATLRFIPDGTYTFQDTQFAHLHLNQHPIPDTTDGSFGLFGILRFVVPGHPGIGVHSGQAHAHYKPGPPHPTFGCIRTTDDAMLNITWHIYEDPLTTIAVVNNNHTVAAQGQRLHRRH